MAMANRGEGLGGGARGGSSAGASRSKKLTTENKKMTGYNQTAPSTSSKNKKIAKSTLTAHQQIVREKGAKTTPKVPSKSPKAKAKIKSRVRGGALGGGGINISEVR